ncbi:MAG TPA: hypothetical protein ENL06_03270 [Candidatus Portnoybacteria bacterium]|nr:hypothetical protein [Candidatus Portnoybacteria bacterium]
MSESNLENIKLYQNSINQNLSIIKDILNDLNLKNKDLSDQYSKTLALSSSKIANKWLSGRKYCRTLFAQQAFKNRYPKKHTLFSLQIDALVNILDDLLDEQLSPEEKTFYILEFLRVFSLHEKDCPEQIKKDLGIYINQLITLAVAEEFYQQRVQKETDFDKIVDISTSLLICRGMDMDIFTQIALISQRNISPENKRTIVHFGRLFRAINILKKDVDDISHDQKNKIKTMTTIVLKKKINFSDYLQQVSLSIIKKMESVLEPIHSSHYLYSIINNFYQMAKDDQNKIIDNLN